MKAGRTWPRVRLRLAEQGDIAKIYDWRFSVLPLAVASPDEEPNFVTHVAWFTDKRQDADTRIYVIQDAENWRDVGYLRLEKQGTSAVISIALDERAIGYGYGRAALSLARKAAWSSTAQLEAYVHHKNFASLRAFWAVGFTLAPHDGPVVKLRYDIRESKER